MATLRLMVTAPHGADPADHLDDAHAAAAKQASAWTEPVFVTEHRHDGYSLLEYVTDAVPRVDPSIVTTANVAPVLQPARVL